MNKQRKILLTLFLLFFLILTPSLIKSSLEAKTNTQTKIKTLTLKLIKNTNSDKEKAWKIYRWITRNIAYDTQSFFSGKYGKINAVNTFLKRKSVCSGYSALFKKMSDYAGLESLVVNGYSKGYGYQVGQAIEKGKTNHAWNVVKIEGQWQLIDSTWGSGFIRNKKFVRKARSSYFLTKPSNFILDHFPSDSQWQLLDEKISIETYQNLVKVYPSYFDYEIKVESHPYGVIETEDKLLITLKAAQDVIFLGELKETKSKRNYVLIIKEKDLTQVHVTFPKEGSFPFYLYAKRKKETGQYQAILKYKINAKSGFKNNTLVKLYQNYNSHHVKFREPTPLTGSLKKKDTYSFNIDAPQAIELALVNQKNKQWTYLEKKGDRFEGKISIQSIGKHVLFAKYKEKGRFLGLAEYEAIP